MSAHDLSYVGLPWKSGGRSRAGTDCAGLAWLWLTENGLLKAPAPGSARAGVHVNGRRPYFKQAWGRGDVVFFRRRGQEKLRHVAVCLGGNRYLHILRGLESRIETGLVLMGRVCLEPAGAIGPDQAEELCLALNDPEIGDPGTWVMIIIAVIALALSLALRPSLAGFNNRRGKYSPDALFTQRSTEIPLPDLLGSVVVAGNSVYQQLADKGKTEATPANQKWNQIVVLSSGPVELIDYQLGLQVKGVSWQDMLWHNGTYVEGMVINPTQDKANAVTGSINGDTKVPSVTLYDGAHGITVPVDVRSEFDRTFPLYGFSGCAYLVFREIDSTKFSNFNVTCRVKGRKCRTFDADGFVTATATAESLAGADGSKVRFKLAHEDIEGIVGSLTVSSVNYAEITATGQSGNVFQLNRTKGFVEFITAPAAAATILVTYTYFVRAWTQNPADHIVYLLTEPGRGKGFDESRIDWPSFVDGQGYFDEEITWVGTNGEVTGPRFTCNYALDERKPLQDHIRAIQDACNSLLLFGGGKFILKAKKGDDASVFSFNGSSILVGDDGESTFEGDLVDRTTRINRAKVLFHSDAAFQAETEVVFDDEANQRSRASRVGNNGVVDNNLKFPAVTDEGTAQRLAMMIVAEEVGSNWQGKWTTNIRGLALQPGDVVDVTHPALPLGAALALRIDTLGYDEMDRLEIVGVEHVPEAYL